MLFWVEKCCPGGGGGEFTTVQTLPYPKSLLREIDKFRAGRRRNFGSVFAASRFWTTEDGNSSNLDWALVEIPRGRVVEIRKIFTLVCPKQMLIPLYLRVQMAITPEKVQSPPFACHRKGPGLAEVAGNPRTAVWPIKRQEEYHPKCRPRTRNRGWAEDT
jgi:hypothetical protein